MNKKNNAVPTYIHLGVSVHRNDKIVCTYNDVKVRWLANLNFFIYSLDILFCSN